MAQVIGTIITGLVIGWLARFLYPGAVPMGWIGTILLGIGGSLLGGFLGNLISGKKYDQGFQPAGCVGSVLGAIIIIFLVRSL